MGKLRVLSGSEVCRILEQYGFVSVRQRGSHRIMQRRTETTTVTVPVPLHDAVRRATLLSIVRQSELPNIGVRGRNVAGLARSEIYAAAPTFFVHGVAALSALLTA